MDRAEALSLLDLGNAATRDEIKARALKLFIEFHPDKHTQATGNPTLKKLLEEKFNKVHEARDYLLENAASEAASRGPDAGGEDSSRWTYATDTPKPPADEINQACLALGISFRAFEQALARLNDLGERISHPLSTPGSQELVFEQLFPGLIGQLTGSHAIGEIVRRVKLELLKTLEPRSDYQQQALLLLESEDVSLFVAEMPIAGFAAAYSVLDFLPGGRLRDSQADLDSTWRKATGHETHLEAIGDAVMLASPPRLGAILAALQKRADSLGIYLRQPPWELMIPVFLRRLAGLAFWTALKLVPEAASQSASSDACPKCGATSFYSHGECVSCGWKPDRKSAGSSSSPASPDFFDAAADVARQSWNKVKTSARRVKEEWDAAAAEAKAKADQELREKRARGCPECGFKGFSSDGTCIRCETKRQSDEAFVNRSAAVGAAIGFIAAFAWACAHFPTSGFSEVIATLFVATIVGVCGAVAGSLFGAIVGTVIRAALDGRDPELAKGAASSGAVKQADSSGTPGGFGSEQKAVARDATPQEPVKQITVGASWLFFGLFGSVSGLVGMVLAKEMGESGSAQISIGILIGLVGGVVGYLIGGHGKTSSGEAKAAVKGLKNDAAESVPVATAPAVATRTPSDQESRDGNSATVLSEATHVMAAGCMGWVGVLGIIAGIIAMCTGVGIIPGLILITNAAFLLSAGGRQEYRIKAGPGRVLVGMGLWVIVLIAGAWGVSRAWQSRNVAERSSGGSGTRTPTFQPSCQPVDAMPRVNIDDWKLYTKAGRRWKTRTLQLDADGKVVNVDTVTEVWIVQADGAVLSIRTDGAHTVSTCETSALQFTNLGPDIPLHGSPDYFIGQDLRTTEDGGRFLCDVYKWSNKLGGLTYVWASHEFKGLMVESKGHSRSALIVHTALLAFFDPPPSNALNRWRVNLSERWGWTTPARDKIR